MNNDRIGARLRSALGHAFGAETVIAGEAGYDDARRVWNGAVDRHPAMVAFCRTSSEVAAAVLAAREVGVPLSVRGGGHQVAGLSVCDNGLTIDLSTMCAVSVDGGISHAGGGSLLRHVDTANAQAGVVVPAGVVSHTGLGGLALGGGFGWTFRNFGLTCDNIVGAEVVTADGRIVQAGEQDDADLLWALRGGGGNFGVVTRFDLGNHPLRDVLFGQAVFAVDDLPRGVEHYVRTMATIPDAMSSICITRLAPPIPGLPPEVVGRPVVMIDAVWSGDIDAGEEPMRRLVGDGKPLTTRITRMPYTAVQTMQDDLHPHGRGNYNKSRYLTTVDDTAIKALREAGNTVPGPHSQIEILRLGGAAGRIDPNATAFAHRDAAYILNIVGAWTDNIVADAHIAWVRDTYKAFDPVGSDAGYINFLDAEPDRAHSVYPEPTYARLREIKRRLDPDSVFRGNVPITV